MEQRRVADLSVDEFSDLLREVIAEVLEERLGLFSDPDVRLELRPEVVQAPQEYMAGDQRGAPAEIEVNELRIDP